MYHMIREPDGEQERRYACPPARFESHMRLLRDNGYNVLGLGEVASCIAAQRVVPARSVVVTLDDGFRDNYENAFPILQRYRIPATIFLASGLMEKTNAWMEGRGYPSRQMLNWDEIAEMANAGIDFGGHTLTHARLSELPEDRALAEIAEGRQLIEDRLGRAIAHFAYPYGLYNERTPALVQQAGYALACSTHSGFNNRHSDAYMLRRLEVYGTDTARQLARKLTFGTNDGSWTLPLRYYWRRVRSRVASA